MKVAALNLPNQLRLTPVEDLLSIQKDDRDDWKVTQSGYFTLVKDAEQAKELMTQITKLGNKSPMSYDMVNKITAPTVLYVETELGRDNDMVEFTLLDEQTLKHMLAGIETLKQAQNPEIS